MRKKLSQNKRIKNTFVQIYLKKIYKNFYNYKELLFVNWVLSNENNFTNNTAFFSNFI